MWQEAVLGQLMCNTDKYAGIGEGGTDKAEEETCPD